MKHRPATATARDQIGKRRLIVVMNHYKGSSAGKEPIVCTTDYGPKPRLVRARGRAIEERFARLAPDGRRNDLDPAAFRASNGVVFGRYNMAVTVKKITLWQTEIENQPGALARALEPPAKAGADLQVVMGYRHPGAGGKATIEISPIAGKKQVAAAGAAGLAAAVIPTLLVEGADKPGTACAIAQALGGASINMAFFIAQVVGKKYAAVIGFENEDDAKKAASLIKKGVKKPKS
jgi:hypothetical protein